MGAKTLADSRPPAKTGVPASKKQPLVPPSFTAGPANLVTCLIGPADNPETFLVHTEFACHASPVLHAALSDGVTSRRTQTYHIGDTTSRAFRFFTQWAYLGKLTMLHKADPEERKALEQAVPPYYKQQKLLSLEELEISALCEGWVLANKLQMQEMQNYIMRHLFHFYDPFMHRPRVINYLYEKTADSSPLRRMIVDAIAERGDKSLFMSLALWDFPHHVLGDILIVRGRYLKIYRPNEDTVEYHLEDAKLPGEHVVEDYLVPTDGLSHQKPILV